MDLLTYDMLIDMHEFDSLGDEFTWNDTPDHIMEKIIESGPVFDMEFGLEDLNEQVRNYLITNSFITDKEQ
jgi:hypothetical protein